MSFKETTLPDFVIAELYPGSLIAEANIQAASNVKGKVIVAVENADLTVPGQPPPETRQPTGPAGVPGLNESLYRYLGKNQKKVSVIARYQDDPYIPEEHLQFLIRILSACKLNLGDVAILNDATLKIQITKLRAELDPAFVLLFDVGPVEIGLPLSFPLLRPQSFDGSHYLTIPSIATLLEENEIAKGLKKKLWDSLKKMFGV